MAAGTLPRPGTKLGPCEPECQHKDCAITRRMAAETCRFCQKPISSEPFYTDPENSRDVRGDGPLSGPALVHAECLERHYEAEDAKA